MPARRKKGHKKASSKAKTSWIKKINVPAWLLLILALIFLFRIPSLFEPYTYGDEMIYLNLGNAARHGMVLYRDIHDNKPPLLYMTAAVAGNLFWFRAILAGWMMATTVAFWKLAKTLFSKEKYIVVVATCVFAVFTTIPLFEGQVANAELFMIGPTIIGFYILLSKKLSPLSVFIAGLFFSIATLFKVPAAFDIGAIVFLWFVALKWKSDSVADFIKNIVILSIGFIVPIALTFVWYWARGGLTEYTIGAFLQNFGYLSSWRPADQQKSFLVKNAPLIVRGLVVLGGFALMYVYRKKLSREFMFSSAWLLVSLFAITLSERPYPHYLIQVVPSMSLLAGILVAKQSIEQSLTVIPLLLLFVTIQRYQFWHYPVFSYYNRFAQYMTGNLSKDQYYTDFDANVVRNYKIAQYIMSTSKPEDKIFVWGDSPVIYALSKRLPPIRYVATYHIEDFSTHEATLTAIASKMPLFIVILPDSPDFPELKQFAHNNYILVHSFNGAEIWKSPGKVITIH